MMSIGIVVQVMLITSLFEFILSIESNIKDTSVLYANVTGDLLLGGLFPVHRKGNEGENCGAIQMEDGIQPLEAMLYTIERINKNPKILPGIQLGAVAFDTCDNPTYALERVFYFIKGSIVRNDRFGVEGYECEDRSVPKFLNTDFDNVVAILGAESSSVTIQVASVLALFPIPQISYMATSPFLSSKEKFPRFFRTVPSDVNQARAMLEILRQFQWSYVSVVYTDSEYGDHGYEMLVSLAANYSICFSKQQRISKDRFKDDDYDVVVRTIAEKTDVKVVVLFAEKATTLRVLEAARRVHVGSRFVWLCSDAWPDHNDINYQQTTVLEGALAVQPLYAPLSGFDEYFTGLTLDHEQKNPWFREFWQTYHNCVYVEEAKYFSSEKSELINCRDPTLKIKRSNGYKQRRFLHFVRDAVYAAAYALHNMQRNVCGENWTSLCDKMRPPNKDIFFQYLANVSFKDEAGNGFRFVDAVDGPPRYSILNYQRKVNGSYHWTVIGNYTLNEREQPILQLDREKLRFRGEQGTEFPTSSCPHPCGSNRIMVPKKEDPCCWTCQSCGIYQYKVDEHKCDDCRVGTIPTENGTGCDPIPEEFVEYSNPWAIFAITIAISGIGLTMFVCSVFWIYRETPMIKASGRELSFLLLLGAFGCFSMTFAVVAKPSVESCAIVRFGIGFCYTVCYAALTTKINRIHRIFNDPGRNLHERRFTSPRSQLMIASILILIEIVFDVSWLLKEPPAVEHSYSRRSANVRVCRGSENGSYVIGLFYPFLLTVASTFYAIKTRKCPEGFNETRCIAFTNYATIILWLAFVPLYLASTRNVIKIITLALSLSLNGLVQLICLFLPKVYVVLIKPEKNTRELVMARHTCSSYPTTPCTPITPELPSALSFIIDRDRSKSLSFC
ncbi:metabotropic glutamate receptor 2 isoform X1 [Apis mellifera carnica]|uniref:Metabotropic glutamate receptor 2 isoform X1 n=2 Tax=Apis mellifera TaxID=7460 RepID=A0A7M7MW51_APIME|nr:metabotropic glutamate receptor 2 isoform X1 [Apis mellifera]KAG9427873.1 metabotropic glutamate receptor 2 isoform X1 [Apis mellifera carnica]|eukprot:XP_026301698.1 metabotropic glutamate receptor 2 isoform X1 [Apis mellifera]